MTHRKPIRSPTNDRAPADAPDILTSEQIGPNRSRTPNGNLLCKNVPVARVGWMVYLPGEVPIDAAGKDHVRIYRGPDELFKPEVLGSIVGAAVVDEHTEEDVTPKNWKEHAQGFAIRAWRGEGEDADVILADLLITDEDLIEAIDSGKREISLGYDADYINTGEGEGRQANILVNHIALVERGRCGPRCAIGDHDPTVKGKEMTKRVKLSDSAKAVVRKLVRDAETLLEEETEPGMPDDGESDGGGTHIHIHTGSAGPAPGGAPDAGGEPGGMPNTVSKDEDPDGGGDPMEARFSRLEQGMEQLSATVAQLAEVVMGKQGGQGQDSDPGKVSEGEGDPPVDEETRDELPDEEDEEGKRATTGDSAALAVSYAALLADAEVLVPGFRAPTFDSKAKRKATVDSMCAIRRKALDACYATAAGKTLIDSVAGVKTLDTGKMTCQQVASVFKASAGAQRLLNNNASTRDARTAPNAAPTQTGPKTLTDINAELKAYWAKQGITS